jgi:hypothetical protein
VILQFEAFRQQGLQHLAKPRQRRIGRGLGFDLEAHILELDPVRAGDLLVVGDAVGVAEAVGETGVG